MVNQMLDHPTSVLCLQEEVRGIVQAHNSSLAHHVQRRAPHDDLHSPIQLRDGDGHLPGLAGIRHLLLRAGPAAQQDGLLPERL